MGTEVEMRGANISEDQLWSAKLLDTNPDILLEVNKDYLREGSDIILTASYQASVENFVKHGYSE